jgi:hypothetical protein
MHAERIAMRRAAPASVVLLLLFATGFLSCCATARYERGAVLAGDDLSETLFLSGEEFRLEAETPQGTVMFAGRLEVTDNEWRFTIQTFRMNDGRVRTFSPAPVYVYRGRSFENGIAFYSRLSPRHLPADLVFITAPCDFDIVR